MKISGQRWKEPSQQLGGREEDALAIKEQL